VSDGTIKEARCDEESFVRVLDFVEMYVVPFDDVK